MDDHYFRTILTLSLKIWLFSFTIKWLCLSSGTRSARNLLFRRFNDIFLFRKNSCVVVTRDGYIHYFSFNLFLAVSWYRTKSPPTTLLQKKTDAVGVAGRYQNLDWPKVTHKVSKSGRFFWCHDFCFLRIPQGHWSSSKIVTVVTISDIWSRSRSSRKIWLKFGSLHLRSSIKSQVTTHRFHPI